MKLDEELYRFGGFDVVKHLGQDEASVVRVQGQHTTIQAIEAIAEPSGQDVNHAPDPSLGRMIALESGRHGGLIERGRSLVGDKAFWQLEPVAAYAIELGSKHRAAPLGAFDPGTQQEGRLVPYVLPVAAR